MFEQTSRLAERVATSVSRRGFLGALGGWAAAAALGVASVLTTASTARAGNSHVCCTYASGGGTVFCGVLCLRKDEVCPATAFGCPLVGCQAANGCGGCHS